jgi:predicted transcriptional regulator
MSRRRALGGGRKPHGPYGANTENLSLRLRADIKTELERLAGDHGRSVSQEAQAALAEWIRRHQEQQRHITGLSEAFAAFVKQVEEATQKRFTEDRFTVAAVQVGTPILFWQLLGGPTQGEPPTPNAIETAASRMPPETRERYTSPMGVAEAAVMFVTTLVKNAASSTGAPFFLDEGGGMNIWRDFSFKMELPGKEGRK